MFIHTVYFWFKPDAPAHAVEQTIGDCKALLAKIPSVRALYAGRPAGTPRAVVDNTYQVGLTVVFDDQAGHDAYQPHPLHDQFVARGKPFWDRVQVYDAVE